jgi:CRISPR system Cascade subunit CasB
MADGGWLVKGFVKHKIIKMTESKNESGVRATLAKLRRGIGKAPGSMPEIWGVTMDGMPEELVAKGDNPTYGEWAAHTALTLYALHQQGKDIKGQCMNMEGAALGASLNRLIKDEADEIKVKRRFDAAATSDDLGEFAHHLRGLVQLLKAQGIPLDYPALAEDLYRFQFPEVRDSVRLNWGRDFYRMTKPKSESDTQ